MVEFNQPLARPKRSAYIRFYNSSDDEVFSLDVMTSANVTFTDTNTTVMVTLQVVYRITERQTYYIILDYGLVANSGKCGKESSGVDNRSFWNVTIQPTDITHPVSMTILISPAASIQKANTSIKFEALLILHFNDVSLKIKTPV